MKKFKQSLTCLSLFLAFTFLISNSIIAQTISYFPAVVGTKISLCDGGKVTVTITGTTNGEVYSLSANPPITGSQTITATGSTVVFADLEYNAVGSYNITTLRTSPTILFFPNQGVDVIADPIAPTLTPSPILGAVNAGTNVSATFLSAGSGGVSGSSDDYAYSIDGGTTWLPYTLGVSLPTISYKMPSLKIKAYRAHPVGTGCVAENIYTWTVNSRVHDNTGSTGSYYNIQQAINAANTASGDILVVDAGTYNEDVNINKSLTIKGPNAGNLGNGTRVAEAIVGTSGGFTISGQNLNVIIDGFKFDGSTAAWIINPSPSPATTDIVFQNNLVDGRQVIYSENLTNMRDVTFTRNKITNTPSNAIVISSINKFTVTDNEFSNIGYVGILLYTKMELLNITNNSFNHIKREAVKLLGSIVDGNVSNNSIIDANYDKAADAGGIRITGVVLPYKVNILNNHIENCFNGVAVQASTNLVGTSILVNNNYLVSNVPGSYGIYNNAASGILNATCNWFGSTAYSFVDSKNKGKVVFVPYSTSDGGPCNELNAVPANLNAVYTQASENIVVNFDVTQNDLQLFAIPGLNPAVPADLLAIRALYATLDAAIIGGNTETIKAAALAVGDDVITEYYYYTDEVNQTGKTYLKTKAAAPNDLIKNKYWQEYLVRSDAQRFPDWATNKTLVTQATYSTSTNPLTGVVAVGWLNPVLGKTLHVKVTLVHNGKVTSQLKSIPIAQGPVNVYNALPVGPATWVSSHTAIKAAINEATTLDGYIVKVDAGTYVEDQLLVNKKLTILGANAGKAGNDNTRGAESVITDSYVLISKDDVTIDGFKFTGTPSTYPVHSAQIGNGGAGGPKPSHGVIKNNFFEKVANNGIFLTSVDNWTIEANRFQGIGNVTGNLGTPVYSAMNLYYGVTNVTIKDNVLHTVDYNGILLNHGDDVIITQNSFTNIQMSGLQLSEACGNVSVTSNTFVDANIINQTDRGAIRIYGQLFDGPINITGNTISGGVAAFAVKAGNNIAGKDIHFNNNSITGSTSGTAIRHMGTGTLDATCNWYGSTDYTTVDSKITGKVVFVPYSTTAGGPCNELNAIPASLAVTYTAVGENVQLQFNVTQNDMQLRAIPGLNPAVPADLAQIAGLYATLKSAIAGGVTSQIQAAALAVGDDVITEYYYMNGTTKVYLKTAGGNDLIKNKYWDKYLVRTSNSERLPDWGASKTLVSKDQYATSTNPLTGAVASGWLNDVLGKDLHVDVTFIHNGTVTTVQKTVAIGAGPIKNVNTGLGYPTIQLAINAVETVNGHVISVGAGTYNENVIVNKELTLLGANADVACGSRGAESLVQDLTAANLPVFIINSNNVTINGFEVKDPFGNSGIDAGSTNPSNLTIKFNNIHDIGNSRGSGNVYAIRYLVGDAVTISNVSITDNCINNVFNSTPSAAGNSAGIWFGQSTSTGIINNLSIDRNSISNVYAGLATKAASGIDIGTAWNNTTGKVNNLKIRSNTISGISGGQGYGIQLDGKTPGAEITNNTISNVVSPFNAAYAVGVLVPVTNTGSALPTPILINNNSITGITYAIANASANIVNGTCNWYGSTDYTTVDSKIVGKVVFVPYNTTASGPCTELNAIPASVALTYTPSGENVQLQFNVSQNDLQLRPIPLLNPAVPADLVQIAALYATLKSAIAGGVTSQIQAAALAVGDDIITEYYYFDGLTKKYVKTAGGNDLIKNKYWDKYLVRTSNSERLPDWGASKTLVIKDQYATSTNPLTGAVASGWLSDVLGKDLHVDVTFVHNGTVTTVQKTIGIDLGPVKVYSALPIGPATLVSSHLKIQTAIDAATTMSGYIITADAGIYAEDITVDKSVTILGPNALVDACSGTRVAEAIVVPATNAVSSGEIFHVAASGVTISGFTIDGDNPSLPVNGYGFGGADMHAAEGITSYETGVNNLTVSNNIFKNLSYFAVTLYDYPAGVASTGHLISNNKMQDLGTYDATSDIANWGGGVLLYNNQYAAVTDNCMTNVRLGIQTGNFSQANPGVPTYQAISGNTIQSRRVGIFHNLQYSSASPMTIATNNISTLSNVNETIGWRGILLGSLQGSTTAFITNNTISGLGSTLPTVEGINVWNCQSNPVITGGTITDVKVGINVNNFEGYSDNASNTATTIDGVTITTASVAGIMINDNALNTNNATVSAEVKGNTTITASPVGILVKGSDASVNAHDNLSSIHGNTIGIDVDGGTSVVTLNHIYDNGIGVRFINSGSGTVHTNRFEGATSNGIDIQATTTAGSVIATQNNWFAGSTYGVENLSGTVIDATANYWNAANGPSTVGTGSGANVTTNVTYCPILSDAPVAFGGTGALLLGPTALSYTPSTYVYTEGMAIALLSPTISGTAPFIYTVSSLPAGLSISSITGEISGTPTAPTTVNTYTVTATNSCGSTTTTLTITIDAIPFGGGVCNLLNEDFTSNPQLANTDVNGAWYPDRYRPASFTADAGKLKIEINAVDGAQLRPTAYVSGFYNTQGRKINQCSGCVTIAKADLFIPSDWATNKRRSDLWATAFDGSNAITAYPIIGFRNATGVNPQMSVYNVGLDSWNELGSPSLGYNTSYTLEMRLNNTNLEYLINGTVVATYPSNGSAYFGNIMLQAYNFNDNNLGVFYDGGPNNSYDALWDNVITTGNNGNVVTNSTTGNTYCSIQSAVDAASINDVITVGAGTYAENVKVTKGVTILGPNALIDACSGTRVAEAILYPAVSDIAEATDDYTIFEVLASNVTISGLTLNGDNPSITTGKTSTNGADIDVADGIARYGSGNNLVVTNNIIKNLSYYGVIMYDYPAGNPSAGNVISGNKFQDLGTYDATSGIAEYGGGVLLYNNQYAAVTDNCMTNVRIGIQTGNFSQANPGTIASQMISGNMIQARKRGIFHNLFYGTASAYTLSNNKITALAHANETILWDGMLLSSLSIVEHKSINNSINGAGLSIPSFGISVWNDQFAPSFTSDTIKNVHFGINVNNFEGYPNAGSNANTTFATIDGVTVSNATVAGIRINDNALNTNSARVSAEVKNSTITNSTIGILVSGADAGGNIHNNIISGGLDGIQVNGTVTTVPNALTISNNTISNTLQEVGSVATRGIALANITGVQAATISTNTISETFYGYGVYHLNTDVVTTISGGTITGVMQGVAIVNTDGVTKKSTSLNVSNTTMSAFAGIAGTAATKFHAGIYTYTSGGTTLAEGITLNVDGVTIDGTGSPSQSSGGISLADFSGSATNVQNVTINASNIINNDNRGLDARGKVNAIVTNSTFNNNGKDAFGTGGNDGYTMIAQKDATIEANNNFITLPSVSNFRAFGLFIGLGTTSQITAHNNSILFNGNATAGSKSASSAAGTGSINATCNWWDICPADYISGNVAAYPYLISGVDSLVAVGFQPTGTCTNNDPAIRSRVTSPVALYDKVMTSGDPEYTLTICSGQLVTTEPVSVVNANAASCSSLRVQTKFTTTISTLSNTTYDLAYSVAAGLPATSITPENHDGLAKDINFESFAYYDLNGNETFDAGDVRGGSVLFKLTVQSTPRINFTVTADGTAIPMESGVIPTSGAYAATICSGEQVSSTAVFTASPDTGVCGPLMIQTSYTTTIGNISPQSYTTYAPFLGNVAPAPITPQNLDEVPKTIVFTTTPYYELDGIAGLTGGDIVGDYPVVFTLTVNPAPRIVCPDNITVSNDPSLCSAVVTYAEPIFTDYCATSSITQTGGIASGGIYPVGTTTNNWKITDGATPANTATCSFTVTVNDTEGPTYVIPSTGGSVSGYICGDTITFNSDVLSCGTSKSIVKPIWSDNCGVVMSTSITATLGGNTVTLSDFGALISAAFPVGKTDIKFTATDNHGNMTSCHLYIKVQDVTPPIITNCPTNIEVTAPAGACQLAVFWQPPTVSDYCPGYSVVTTHFPGTQFPVGQTTTVTYTAKDGAGNTTICTFNVKVNGTCAPTNPDIRIRWQNPFNGIFTTGQTKDAVIRLNEVGNIATSGTIQIFIPLVAGYTFTFDDMQTIANNPSVTVGNATDGWSVFTYPNGSMLLTTNSSIPASGEFRVAIKMTANSSLLSSVLKATVIPGSGGDNNAANNGANTGVTTL